MADEVECGVVVQSQDFSCSGVILDSHSGLVLTVGSIANGVFANIGNELGEKGKKISPINLGNIPPIQVVLKSICKDANQNVSEKDFLTLHGSVIALWRDASLYELQRKIFPEGEWSFETGKIDETEKSEKSEKENTDKQQNSSFNLADFVLIEVKHLSKYSVQRFRLTYTKVQPGDLLSIIGTPFGFECYSVFFNSLSKGIVSNAIGSNNHMILTDARCVPGNEGCPVFIGSSTEMIVYGIVVAPFCWRSGEWIGLTLVYSLSHILQNFLHSNILENSHPSGKALKALLSASGNAPRDLEPCSENESFHRALRSVVLVQAGSTWGSGIVIDANKGLVITCRHILTEGGVYNSETSNRLSVPLMVHDIQDNKVYDIVDILHATDSDCFLDFALLKVKSHDFKTDIILEESKTVKMEQSSDVFAIGYSIFGHQTCHGPCVTMGTISKVSFSNGMPIMLQTTAAVHCGGSGGAIISRRTGQLLGMVTCNIKDGTTMASFPHINFSIPVNVIKKLISLSLCDESERCRELSRLVSGGNDHVWCLGKCLPAKSKL